MLYERWRQIALSRPDQLALCELAGGRRWSFGALARVAAESARRPERMVFPRGDSAQFILDVLCAWRWGQVVCPLEPGRPRPEIGGDLPAEIVHLKTTSATTGAPRLVAFTALQLMADAQNIVTTMGLRPGWPNLGVISLAHSYGFSNLALSLLLHGIPLILAGGALPESLRRAAALQPSVTLAAVPALWKTWHDAGAIPPNVQLAISAGAPLPLALEQAILAAHGLKIHNFYGSTECGGIAYDATAQARRDEACVGTPIDGVEARVAQDGCLEVRSEAVGHGYWPEPSPDLRAGTFRSCDLGEISEGHIYLRGRASDQINVAGRKVLPETIERALAIHPNVRHCLVFGVGNIDGHRGDIIVACVALRSAVSAEALRQFATLKLLAWQVPREWWFVDSLETNPRGKLSRAQWRQRYLQSRGAGA